jgi:hypothetical protein
MLVNEKCTALKEVCDIFDLTNMIKAKLYMNVHWMVLYKKKRFETFFP